ncbi:MAG: hypothetical protein HOM14_02250 [Gammaproteobacteria bacterium]|jgi:hypothetical protein|nr:hypothetical protein [Gammaproteobacteria bacterium]MBT3724715.1 hypothetical protein [Gammaproteobacteria bacterium]MBT4076480.1 hypothetical protein [Gammaproteobacteria bacterium]MBT4192820.1 hypothetical protein [Gammaproteobacteria bacterium]MBT4448741.1 hypothetical protein [Gammaproteobacteria bacterium]
MLKRLLFVVIFSLLSQPVFADDSRVKVELPDMMREHMLSNMRDHLLALEEITRFLANQNYDKAAEVAENRLGMSSLNLHGASHMGKFMPKEMGAIGTNMHRAASRFATAAKDAELDGGLNKAFSALSEVMQQCVACHSGYKVH